MDKKTFGSRDFLRLRENIREYFIIPIIFSTYRATSDDVIAFGEVEAREYSIDEELLTTILHPAFITIGKRIIREHDLEKIAQDTIDRYWYGPNNTAETSQGEIPSLDQLLLDRDEIEKIFLKQHRALLAAVSLHLLQQLITTLKVGVKGSVLIGKVPDG